MFGKNHFFGSQYEESEARHRQLSHAEVTDAVETHRVVNTSYGHLSKMMSMNPSASNKKASEVLKTCKDELQSIVQSFANSVEEGVADDYSTSSDFHI